MQRAGGLSVVFLGQSSRLTLEPLLAVAQRHRLVGIVEAVGSKPPSRDAKKSRLQKLAEHLRIPHFWLRRGEQHLLFAFLSAIKPDLGCVSSFPLLEAKVLEIPRYGFINFHPSLLPKYRGPNPWFWQYYHMEKVGGVSIHFLSGEEDSGDLIYQEPVSIKLGLPLAQLQSRCLLVGARLMARAADALAAGNCPRKRQTKVSIPIRARRLEPDELPIDWNVWSLVRVWHLLRGAPELLRRYLPSEAGQRRWKIGALEPQPAALVGGLLRTDSRGWYLAHPEGKIRLEAK